MTTERRRLIERRHLVVKDIEELALQVSEGEIDDVTYGALLGTYQNELDSLDAAIGELPEPAPEPKAKKGPTAEPAPAEDAPTAPRRSPRRVLVGSIVLIAALSAAIAFAARDTSPEDTAPVAASPGGLTVDPATVSNEELEAVVAANPDINAMREALADRYFAAEEYGSALDHYLYIAGNDPTPPEESRAFARLGWMAYATGLPEAAEEYVLSSLDVDPTNTEATLFLGFITLYGLEDAEKAIPQLEAALAIPDLREDIVSQVEAALEDARSRGG